MNIEYLRTAKKSYMIIKNADYEFENYELQMILHNDIPCLLQFQIIVGDGAVEYWYDVTGMQSLEKQFSLSMVNEKQLRFLLENLIEMKYAMEEYLLNDRNIYLAASMIFFDRFSDRIRFCYIPGLSGQGKSGEKELFEDILQHLDHTDPMAVSMGYDMYDRCMKSEFIVEDCRECLRLYGKEKKTEKADCREDAELMVEDNLMSDEPELKNYKVETGIGYKNYREGTGTSSMKFEDTEDGVTEVRELEFLQPEAEKKNGHKRKRKRNKKKKTVDYKQIFEEEQSLSFAAEDIHSPNYTECFSEETMMDLWELVYKGDGLEKDFQIESFPYFVGTDAQKVQGALISRTVSRVHAKLFLENNKLFLEDFNSTNGTYLNHRMVPMNTPVELRPGDRVVFATEEYVVYCKKVSK